MGKRVYAYSAVPLKAYEPPAHNVCKFFVRAANVDDPHDRACGVIVVHDVIHQKGLPVPGRGAHQGVEVVCGLVEQVHTHNLALPA